MSIVGQPRKPSLASRMHILEMEVNQAVLDRMSELGFAGIRRSHISFVDQMGDGCRMSEMARRLGLTGGAVTQIADQLEKLALVERKMDPTDRRALIVRPTEQVRAAWAQARQIVDEVEVAWRRKLGKKRFAQLQQMLVELAE